MFIVDIWRFSMYCTLHVCIIGMRKGWEDIIPTLSLSGGVKTPPRPLNSSLVWKVNSLTLPPAMGGGWINPKGWQYVFFFIWTSPSSTSIVLLYCTRCWPWQQCRYVRLLLLLPLLVLKTGNKEVRKARCVLERYI